MKAYGIVARTGCGITLGVALAAGGAVAAQAAEHEATTSDGVATVKVDLGGEFADRTATVLVLDAEADPAAPTTADIAYVTELVVDPDGAASFRAALPGGLDYWLAVTPEDGDRYVAMLDGSEPGDDGSDDGDDGGADDGDDGGSDDGDDGGSDDGDDGPDADGPGDDGSDGPGDDDSDAGGSDGGDDGAQDDGGPGDGGGGGAGAPGDDGADAAGDLPATGMASWFIPAGLLTAAGLFAAGWTLVRRRAARV